MKSTLQHNRSTCQPPPPHATVNGPPAGGGSPITGYMEGKGATSVNYLEADVIGQKVFIWRTREPFGLFAKIGYGDGGAPQFTKDEWERLSREVSALLALAEEWPDD